MQLARNLFLNQDKNLFRKIEECLITFVMEQPGLFTKEKILESYLTIAEWGPGISGIVNASQFYFGKVVSDLTYDEAIFLALLLPNPLLCVRQTSCPPKRMLKLVILLQTKVQTKLLTWTVKL